MTAAHALPGAERTEGAPVDDRDGRVPHTASDRWVDRGFRWLTVAMIPFASMVVFHTLFIPIADPDTFWHLRLGEYALRSWRFSGPEPWSPLTTRPMVLHEWAPEVLYAVGYRLGGLPAIVWIQGVGGVALLLTLYVCSRQFAPAIVASITALVGYVGVSGSVTVRPQLTSFILTTVFATVWMRTARDGRARWWLVPLTWIWACSHGMWFVGVAIGSAVIVGMALDRAISVRSAARLAAVPVLSIVAAGLTPAGPGLLLTAVGMRGYTHFITEWAVPSVFQPRSLATLGLAAVIVALWVRTEGRTPWPAIALWAVGVSFALMYARTVALGACVLVVLAASVLAQHVRIAQSRAPSLRLEASAVVLGTVAALLLGPMVATADISRPAGVPTGLEAQLRDLPAGTVVFNDYGLGGWLLWAHPDLVPVIDGRADVYDIDYFNATIGAYGVAHGWEETVRSSGAKAALLETDSPLAEGLSGLLGWTRVASDGGYTLLEPRPGSGP